MAGIKMNIQKLDAKAPKLNLTKVSETPLKNLLLQVEWKSANPALDLDLDLSAFGCYAGVDGSPDEFIFTPEELGQIQRGEVYEAFGNMLFFKNKRTPWGVLPKDVRGGEDDEPEKIYINSEKWAQNAKDVEKINLWVSTYVAPPVYEGDTQGVQPFGELKEGLVKLINADTKEVLQVYDIGRNDPNANSMYIGSLSLENGELNFKAGGVDGTPMAGRIETIVDVLSFYYQG